MSNEVIAFMLLVSVVGISEAIIHFPMNFLPDENMHEYVKSGVITVICIAAIFIMAAVAVSS